MAAVAAAAASVVLGAAPGTVTRQRKQIEPSQGPPQPKRRRYTPNPASTPSARTDNDDDDEGDDEVEEGVEDDEAELAIRHQRYEWMEKRFQTALAAAGDDEAKRREAIDKAMNELVANAQEQMCKQWVKRTLLDIRDPSRPKDDILRDLINVSDGVEDMPLSEQIDGRRDAARAYEMVINNIHRAKIAAETGQLPLQLFLIRQERYDEEYFGPMERQAKQMLYEEKCRLRREHFAPPEADRHALDSPRVSAQEVYQAAHEDGLMGAVLHLYEREHDAKVRLALAPVSHHVYDFPLKHDLANLRGGAVLHTKPGTRLDELVQVAQLMYFARYVSAIEFIREPSLMDVVGPLSKTAALAVATEVRRALGFKQEGQRRDRRLPNSPVADFGALLSRIRAALQANPQPPGATLLALSQLRETLRAELRRVLGNKDLPAAFKSAPAFQAFVASITKDKAKGRAVKQRTTRDHYDVRHAVKKAEDLRELVVTLLEPRPLPRADVDEGEDDDDDDDDDNGGYAAPDPDAAPPDPYPVLRQALKDLPQARWDALEQLVREVKQARRNEANGNRNRYRNGNDENENENGDGDGDGDE